MMIIFVDLAFVTSVFVCLQVAPIAVVVPSLAPDVDNYKSDDL